MEKKSSSDLFLNDGSFMERFKQLQQENQKTPTKEEPKFVASGSSASLKINSNNTLFGKKQMDLKSASSKKSSTPASTGGKLAFSLKQKSKISAAPVKLDTDEDEHEEQAEIYRGEPAKRQKSSGPSDVVPAPPRDLAVKNVADKLANFVAKNGRQFENVTRQRNPGDTPFKFLFDLSCPDYKYYEYRVQEEEKLLSQQESQQEAQLSRPETSKAQNSYYQMPASALYNGEGSSSGPPPANDPIAMMEFYMKKAAHEERRRQPKQSMDEMPPPASLQAQTKKGHHMGDFIPPEELEKFLSSCNDVSAQKAAREAAERAKIQADNIGHRLLSKMGWKEGEGLGSGGSGRAEPVAAGSVKLNNLGVGAEQPGEVTAEDDIYEQYKKRMMLGYRYRPNPLNNPRKAYY